VKNHPPQNHRWLRRAAAVTVAATLLIGCGSDDSPASDTGIESQSNDSIAIELARSPRAADGQTTTPVYGILVNKSTSPIRVISATSPLANSIDLLNPDETVQLPADGFLIAVDSGVVMEPVGYKLMLTGIDPSAITDEIPVTLRFDSGDSFTFDATVQELDR